MKRVGGSDDNVQLAGEFGREHRPVFPQHGSDVVPLPGTRNVRMKYAGCVVEKVAGLAVCPSRAEDGLEAAELTAGYALDILKPNVIAQRHDVVAAVAHEIVERAVGPMIHIAARKKIRTGEAVKVDRIG